MKLIRFVSLLFLLVKCNTAFSQKYHISAPPVDGYFYVDANVDDPVKTYANRCLDIVTESSTVVCSGKGRVLFCDCRPDRTYDIGIRYASSFVVYTNLIKKTVQKNQIVDRNVPIGELNLNKRDKKYHLGLQVREAGTNAALRNNKLVEYLHGSPDVD